MSTHKLKNLTSIITEVFGQRKKNFFNKIQNKFRKLKQDDFFGQIIPVEKMYFRHRHSNI